MKYLVENEYKTYSFIKSITLSSIFFIIFLLGNYLDFNKWVKFPFLIVAIIIFISAITNLLLFFKYKNNNYINLEGDVLIYNFNNFYTLFFKETIVPTKNILYYSINQNILLKKFNLFKVIVSCGVTIEKFYLKKENLLYFENYLLKHIKNNTVVIKKESDLDER